MDGFIQKYDKDVIGIFNGWYRLMIRGTLRPWYSEDLSLFREINRGEHFLGGFRNRDIAALLYPQSLLYPRDRRRVSARISRRLRLLPAHHIIKKIPHTHRYQLAAKGRQIVTAILQSQELILARLTEIAA
ncbi:MAG: hypothetical protein SVV80_03295 [Planctomycetota bacterium]|nr:hypothetical protein [Planctomycetota bacterium]